MRCHKSELVSKRCIYGGHLPNPLQVHSFSFMYSITRILMQLIVASVGVEGKEGDYKEERQMGEELCTHTRIAIGGMKRLL